MNVFVAMSNSFIVLIMHTTHNGNNKYTGMTVERRLKEGGGGEEGGGGGRDGCGVDPAGPREMRHGGEWTIFYWEGGVFVSAQNQLAFYNGKPIPV